MAIHGFDDLKIELDNAASAAQDISQYCTGDFSVQKNAINEQIDGAGDAIDRYAFVGMFTREPITLEGPMDDTAESLYDILKSWASGERTLKITWDDPGTSDVTIYEAVLENFNRSSGRGALSKVSASLRLTGAES